MFGVQSRRVGELEVLGVYILLVVASLTALEYSTLAWNTLRVCITGVYL
jgi:hypothetical protein